VRWYVENEWWWRKIKSGEYQEYYRRQYAERLARSRPDLFLWGPVWASGGR